MAGRESSRRKDLGDLFFKAQPFHTGKCQDNTIEIRRPELLEPRIQITPQGDHLKIVSEMEELGLPPQTARSDLCSSWEIA